MSNYHSCVFQSSGHGFSPQPRSENPLSRARESRCQPNATGDRIFESPPRKLRWTILVAPFREYVLHRDLRAAAGRGPCDTTRLDHLNGDGTAWRAPVNRVASEAWRWWELRVPLLSGAGARSGAGHSLRSTSRPSQSARAA